MLCFFSCRVNPNVGINKIPKTVSHASCFRRLWTTSYYLHIREAKPVRCFYTKHVCSPHKYANTKRSRLRRCQLQDGVLFELHCVPLRRKLKFERQMGFSLYRKTKLVKLKLKQIIISSILKIFTMLFFVLKEFLSTTAVF